MSEVVRDRHPHAERGGVFSRPVETAAATSLAGQIAPSASNVFAFQAVRTGSRTPRRMVAIRELQAPVQMLADLGFALLWGLCTAGFLAVLHVSGHFTLTGKLWNSLVFGAVALVLERATTRANPFTPTNRSMRFRQAVTAWTYGLAGFLFCGFAFRTNTDVSRAFLTIFYGGGLVVFGFWRALMAPVIARVNQKLGRTACDFVVLGDASRPGVHQFVDELASGECGAFLVPLNVACSDAEWAAEQQRVSGEACRALHGAQDASIYLCSAGLSMPRLEALCQSLSILPVGTYIVPDPATAGLARCQAFAIGGRVAFELRRPPMSKSQQFAKRAVDLVFGTLALIALSPVMIAAALAIRIDSEGPVFFCQTRTGKGGAPFKIFKFRSMYVMEDGPTIQQASRNDPRVTRVGRFLRASSIDELPQIFNVLRGEMSLVGPRPHALAHDQHYVKEIANYELRQHVKPGITGWAQANGLRGETASLEAMYRRIEFDIWYALNASLLLDFEIMVRTVVEVCRPRNAY